MDTADTHESKVAAAERELAEAIGALPLPWGAPELTAPLARVTEARHALLNALRDESALLATAKEVAWFAANVYDDKPHQFWARVTRLAQLVGDEESAQVAADYAEDGCPFRVERNAFRRAADTKPVAFDAEVRGWTSHDSPIEFSYLPTLDLLTIRVPSSPRNAPLGGPARATTVHRRAVLEALRAIPVQP